MMAPQLMSGSIISLLIGLLVTGSFCGHSARGRSGLFKLSVFLMCEALLA